MPVSVEDVRRIARLARLRFDQDEQEKLANDLSEILGFMDQLDEVDTTGIPPMSHVLDIQNVMRDDEVEERMSQDEALKHAPDTQDGFIRVPRGTE